MHNPALDHWKALKENLRYLKDTLTYGLYITPSSSFSVRVYCDASWDANLADYRSHHVFAIYYGTNLISCPSRKQYVVEFRAVAFATSEVSWLMSLLKELRLSCPHTPTILCDNISAIDYSKML